MTFSGWDLNASIDELARRAEWAYFGIDRRVFSSFPSELQKRCCDLLQDNAFCEDAFRTLMYFHRAMLTESQGCEHPIYLAALLNETVACRSALAAEIGDAILTAPEVHLRLAVAIKRRHLCTTVLGDNPLEAIEAAFPDEECVDDDRILRALLFAGHRGLGMARPDTRPFAVLFALYEGREWMLAGKLENARAVLDWAELEMNILERSCGPQQRILFGNVAFIVAGAAQQVALREMQLGWLRKAKTLFRDSPDDVARCALLQAQDCQKLGEYYEALLRYEEAEQGSLSNRTLATMISTCKQEMLDLLAGQNPNWEMYSQAANETIPEFVAILHFFGERIGKGSRFTEDELSHIARETEQLVERRARSLSADSVLSLYLELLDFMISSEASVLRWQPILEKAERFVPGSRKALQVRFMLARRYVDETNRSIVAQGAQLAGGLSLSDTFAQLRQDSGAAGRKGRTLQNSKTCPADEIILDDLDELFQIGDPGDRLNAMQLVLNLARPSQSRNLCLDSLRHIVSLAERSFEELRASQPTPESGSASRHGWQGLIEGIGMLVMWKLGMSLSVSAGSVFHRDIMNTREDADESALCDLYWSFAHTTSSWLIDGYAQLPLKTVVESLGDPQARDLQDCHASMRQSVDRLRPGDLLDEPTLRSAALASMQRLRRFRALARSALKVPSNMSHEVVAPNAQQAEVLLLSFGHESMPAIVGFARRSNSYHVWSSGDWGTLAAEYAAIPKSASGFEALDKLLEEMRNARDDILKRSFARYASRLQRNRGHRLNRLWAAHNRFWSTQPSSRIWTLAPSGVLCLSAGNFILGMDRRCDQPIFYD